MMKKILVLILCVLVYSALFAQSYEDKKTVFQLSFVPPLSTNGAYSHQYTNTVSLNLLVGISRNEEAFTWGGISNIILNDAKELFYFLVESGTPYNDFRKTSTEGTDYSFAYGCLDLVVDDGDFKQ